MLPNVANWVVKRKNMKFLDLLYRTWCPTWENYDDRLIEFPQLESPQWVSERLVSWVRHKN